MKDGFHSIKVEHQGRILYLFEKNFTFMLMFSLLAAEENFDDWKNIPNYNYDPAGFIKWAAIAPIKILYHFTIPDCRNPR